jgi:hypothetical protein
MNRPSFWRPRCIYPVGAVGSVVRARLAFALAILGWNVAGVATAQRHTSLDRALARFQRATAAAQAIEEALAADDTDPASMASQNAGPFRPS